MKVERRVPLARFIYQRAYGTPFSKAHCNNGLRSVATIFIEATSLQDSRLLYLCSPTFRLRRVSQRGLAGLNYNLSGLKQNHHTRLKAKHLLLKIICAM